MSILKQSCLKYFSTLANPKADFDEAAFAESLVRDLPPTRSIDIFQIKPDHAQNQKLLKMFKIQKSMRHSNIAAVVDSMATSNYLFIESQSMEYSLQHLLKSKRKQLSMNHIKFIFYQMVLAVGYLHHQGVEHLDLHPQNFLISEDCEIKLSGFVNASVRKLPKQEEFKSSYQNYYTAPEVMLNNGENPHCLFKADIWALGCMFFELLEGKSLFYFSRYYLDQLKWIFRLLGVPPADLEWITNLQARGWVSKMRFAEKRASSYLGAGKSCPLVCDLLDKMLAVDPGQRVSAVELLKHPFFKDLFDEQDVLFGKKRIRLEDFLYCHPKYKDARKVRKAIVRYTLD